MFVFVRPENQGDSMAQLIERTLEQGATRRASLRHLSGGVAITVIALSASHALAQETAQPSTPHWKQVAGPPNVKLKQISVGSAKAVWGLGTGGLPWKRHGSSWEKMVSSGAVSNLSVAADGTVWATNPSDSMRVLKLDQVNKKWTHNIPTGMKQAAAVNATAAWGLNNAGTLFWLNGTTWEKKAGTVNQISVGSDGTLWATADSKRVL